MLNCIGPTINVSFVIPTLNQADFLKRCIDSCLSQRIAKAEVLVQDGGSSDETLDILEHYTGRVDWVSQPDGGQSDAVNQAIARARGDIIAWINSDDYYPNSEVVKRVLEMFESNSRLDIVYGDGMFVNPSGQVLRRYEATQFQNPRWAFISRASSPCAQPAVFFRRELYLAIGGLREDLDWTLDQELFLRMFAAARTWRYLPEVLAHMTLHSDAKSVRGIAKQVRESAKVKKEFLQSRQGTTVEYAMVTWCTAKMQLYRLAMATGVIRAYWASRRWLAR